MKQKASWQDTDDPIALTQFAIPLVWHKLHHVHGVQKIPMGVEIETVIEEWDKLEEALTNNGNYLRKLSQNKNTKYDTRNYKGEFAGKGLVSNFYQEVNADNQLEIVISHRRETPVSPGKFAKKVEKFKKEFVSKLSETFHITNKFTAYDEKNGYSSGTHVSFSLHDTKRNFLSYNKTSKPDVESAAIFLSDKVNSIIEEMMPIIATNGNSYKRFSGHKNRPPKLIKTGGFDSTVRPKLSASDNSRIEVRVFGADTDSSVAVLTTLLGILAAFEDESKQLVFDKKDGLLKFNGYYISIPPPKPIPSMPEESLENIKKGTVVESLLNGLAELDKSFEGFGKHYRNSVIKWAEKQLIVQVTTAHSR